MSKNYYEILGVSRNAPREEIQKAFHRLAHKYHPDKKGGDEAKFKEVNEAYQVLSNDQRRAEYDAYGNVFSGGGRSGSASGAEAGGFGFDFDFSNMGGTGAAFDLGDIFSDFFGGRAGGRGRGRRGRDISVDIQISFAEAVFGTERKVIISKISVCSTCQGKGGAPGSAMIKCQVCAGRGKLHETRQSLLGSFTTVRECQNCLGTGEMSDKKCPECAGHGVVKKNEEIQIVVPAGISDGEMIRLSGQGEATRGGVTGDLYVKVHVEAHAMWRRDGNNLTTDLAIKLTDALLGNDYTVEALDGNIKVKVPEGVNHGDVIKVKDRGVPLRGGKRGDLLIRVMIKTPSKLSRQARKLVEELRREGI